jgi:hypothetical protein
MSMQVHIFLALDAGVDAVMKFKPCGGSANDLALGFTYGGVEALLFKQSSMLALHTRLSAVF